MPSKLARASFWSIGGNLAQFSIGFFLVIYLAHILQPRDFGLMSMVGIGLDLGGQVVRWGQIELLQQLRYRNDDARNQALRLSMAIACVFAAVFLLAAGPCGRFYGSEKLTMMMYISAPVFLFVAARTTVEGILRSEFQFRLFAIRGTITTIASGVVGVVLAAKGFGALALATQSLVQAAMLTIWVWTAVPWRPRIFGRVPWSTRLLREGASIMVGTALPSLVPRMVDFFVGTLLGPGALGLMRAAYRINDFVAQAVLTPLVSIAQAHFSGLGADINAMRQSYLRLTQVSATLMCPLLIGLGLVAPEAVPIVFGRRWLACVPLVQAASVLALVAPMNYYFSATMVALGHSRLVLRQGVAQLCLGVALAVIAARISLEAVVIANVIRGGLMTLYNVFDLRRRMKMRLVDLWRSMAPPYVATGLMAMAVVGARHVLAGGLSGAPMLMALATVGGVAYISTLLLGERLSIWPGERLAILALAPGRWRAALVTPADSPVR